MKVVFSFAVCCVALVLLIGTLGLSFKVPPAASFLMQAGPPQFSKADLGGQTATLLFVGDIMLNRGVELEIKRSPPAGGGGDWTWPFHRVADTLQGADLVFGNLESQISDKGENVGSIYSFRANPASIEGLVYAGFTVLSVANNHSFDYGRAAFEDSLSRLKAALIAPVANSLVVKQVKDTSIGFLAYSNFPGAGHADWNNLEETLRTIEAARAQVDMLVISLHAGEEYASEPNEFQKVFSQGAIEAGADLVVGHHSHVVQPLVPHARKDGSHGWIAYGLGNFVFDQSFSEETLRGVILKVLVENKTIKQISLLQTRLTPSLQVQIEE